MHEENGQANLNPTAEPTVQLGSGIYVDVENLQTAAQEVVQTLLQSWPDSAPVPSLLSLHVRADQSDLWSMWAESQFPHLSVKAKGIQHFSANPAKNSADIAIAIDAMTDFLMRRIDCVAVVSDDSDFISLYSKLKDEQIRIGCMSSKVPFLWVVTDRPKTRSLNMRDYFPNDHVFVVPFPKKANTDAPKTGANESHRKGVPAEETDSIFENMAQAIVRETDVGPFKSTDTQSIIKSHWSSHSLAKASKQTYGEEFRKKLLPPLQKYGVTEPDPNKKPREYRMTDEAKSSVS